MQESPGGRKGASLLQWSKSLSGVCERVEACPPSSLLPFLLLPPTAKLEIPQCLGFAESVWDGWLYNMELVAISSLEGGEK